MEILFKRLDHIQICVPKDKEKKARSFYIDLLDLEEIAKPAYLKVNGGFWLKIADIQLHIGLEDKIYKSKRHPALEVEHLKAIKDYLLENQIKIKEDQAIPHFKRFSFYDPFGNRIELLERNGE
jgi:catechol 2,3-dioxygenase-like lactoylglutathione lyase family enzyme